MYSRIGQPKWILVGQILNWSENGQWPIVISSTGLPLSSKFLMKELKPNVVYLK